MQSDKLEGTYPKGDVRFPHIDVSTPWIREHFFINCWNTNEGEVMEMWNNYVGAKEGVCIQSTADKLITSFVKSHEYIHLTMVNYEGFGPEPIQVTNAYEVFTHKSKDFEFEQELRAVVKKGIKGVELAPTGLNIPCNLDILIEEIIIPPGADIWFQEMVEVLLLKFGLDKPVKASRL